MYAVIETGSKQYKVAKDDIILIERLPGQEGKVLKLTQPPNVASIELPAAARYE